MADVTIVAESLAQAGAMRDRREYRRSYRSFEKLAASINQSGLSVKVGEELPSEIHYGEDYATSVIPETIIIVITTSAVTAIINSVVTDIYGKCKKWASEQFSKQKSRNKDGVTKPKLFIIYGSDNSKLMQWQMEIRDDREILQIFCDANNFSCQKNTPDDD